MIKLKTGKYIHLRKDKEYQVWAVKNGDIEGTEAQQAYVSHVEAVYLDRTAKDCPLSYLTAKAAVIAAVEATEHVKPVGEYAAVMGVRA